MLEKKTQRNIIQVAHTLSDHPYRILITVGSGSGKTNLLFNLVSQQSHTDKVY